MQPVIDYLRKNQKRFVRELCDYVRFPSVSAQPGHREDMNACARWLVRHTRKGIGLQARLRPTGGHPVVIAKTPRAKNSKRPHFVIYGHYDVQPAEPFELLEIAARFTRASGDTQLFCPRRHRQQGPEPGAFQGRRGLPENRNGTAM